MRSVKLLACIPILVLLLPGCIDEAIQDAADERATSEVSDLLTEQAVAVQIPTIKAAMTQTGEAIEQTEDAEDLASETPTPTSMVSWEGSWTIWGNLTEYTLTLTQSGNTIHGSFNDGDSEVIISGFISDDNSFVSGEWEDSDHSYGIFSGPFEWHQINADQFTGNLSFDNSTGGLAPWCGARNGAPQPDPCFGP